jgi:5'(3')-deoxyribonucleotidase
VCSASHPITIWKKVENCLLKHFEYLNTEQLIFAYRKQLINADFCVDDGIHNLIDAPYQGILISTPYNESFKGTEYEKDMVRVNSFKEVYDYVQKKATE